jgi:uncharacterized membrane protein YfcA
MPAPALLPLVALSAFLYAFIGHAGASAYLSLGLLAGLGPAAAKGQALMLNLAVAGFSAFFFTRAVKLRWGMLAWLLAGSVPAAIASGGIVVSLPVFRALVAFALAAAALRLVLAPRNEPAKVPAGPWLLLLGAGLGLLSGLTGVGGGIYLSPILLLAGWADARETAAFAAWFILINSIAGLIGYLGKHPVPRVEPAWAAVAALAGVLGAWQGSRAPSVNLRRALAGVTVLAALKFLI